MLLSVVLEIIKGWVELSLGSEVNIIEFLINPVIFWINFQLRLIIISILLLFLGEVSKEESEIFIPSFSLSIEHSLFSTFVIKWISHGSSFEFLDLVENSIEFHDRLFN